MAIPRTAPAGFALIVFGLVALPCRADEAPIATASRQGSTSASGQEAVLQIPQERRAYPDVAPPPEDDRRAHGLLEVGVGTGGYRHAAGVISAPIGRTGQVTVAVEKSDGPARWR